MSSIRLASRRTGGGPAVGAISTTTSASAPAAIAPSSGWFENCPGSTNSRSPILTGSKASGIADEAITALMTCDG